METVVTDRLAEIPHTAQGSELSLEQEFGNMTFPIGRCIHAMQLVDDSFQGTRASPVAPAITPATSEWEMFAFTRRLQ